MRSRTLFLTLLLLAAFSGCRKHDFKDQVVGTLDQEQTDQSPDPKSADQLAKEEAAKKAEEEEKAKQKAAEEEAAKKAADKKAEEDEIAKQKAEEEKEGKKADPAATKKDKQKSDTKSNDTPAPAAAPVVEATAMDGYKEVLQAAVVGDEEDGLINYDEVIRHQDQLKLFIASAASEETKSFQGPKLAAFLINLHNAAVLNAAANRKKDGKLVYAGVDKKGAWSHASGPVYDDFFKKTKIEKVVAMGTEPVSLNDIRERVRKEFIALKTPSAYTVTSLYLAATSSPLIPEAPYSQDDPELFGDQLHQNAVRFLSHPTRGRVVVTNRGFHITGPAQLVSCPKVFSWFLKTDFGGKDENIVQFLRNVVESLEVVDAKLQLEFMDFDYSLDDVSSTSNE